MHDLQIRSARGGDVDAMSNICAGIGTIALHDRYLFWLFATVYSSRSLVATVDEEVGAYLLSAPVPERRAEFIVQVAVAPQVQRRRVALALLEEHRLLLRRDGISHVQTSITVGCGPGEALMRRAIAAGFAYQPISWPPEAADPVLALGAEEVLFEAEV
jgi:ribosomal protein S18 acetylase RimI-like enzyme